MKLAGVFLALLLIATPAVPAVPAAPEAPVAPAPGAYDESLPDPAQEARARALYRELRCVVCQGQSIDDSNAPLAADLRALVREQIVQGDSDDEIKDFMVARYGAFVLLRPPLRGDTYALWFAPFVLLLIGAGAVGLIVVRARRRAALEPPPEDGDADGASEAKPHGV